MRLLQQHSLATWVPLVLKELPKPNPSGQLKGKPLEFQSLRNKTRARKSQMCFFTRQKYQLTFLGLVDSFSQLYHLTARFIFFILGKQTIHKLQTSYFCFCFFFLVTGFPILSNSCRCALSLTFCSLRNFSRSKRSILHFSPSSSCASSFSSSELNMSCCVSSSSVSETKIQTCLRCIDCIGRLATRQRNCSKSFCKVEERFHSIWLARQRFVPMFFHLNLR